MLEAIRGQKIAIKIILGLVVFSFVIFYAGNFAGVDKNDPGRHIAAVGKEKIPIVEYQNMIEIMKRQYSQGNQELSPQMMEYFREQAVNSLIDRRMILLEARKAGITASDIEVREAILKSPYFQRDGKFIGMEDYKRVVDYAFHMDIDSFEKMVREDIVNNKFNDLIGAGILVSDKQVEDEYIKKNLTAKIAYVKFEANAGEEIQATPEEVRTYYDSHRSEFETGELRKAQYLWISHQSEKNKVQIPEARLKEYYEKNIDRFSRPEQVHARHILLKTEGKDEAAVQRLAQELVARLRAGANFEQLAKEFSEDPGSKGNGGDLGLFGKGQMVPEFEQVAFSLQPDQISDPVKTQFGYHIIEVLQKQPAYKMDFALVKDQIYRQLSLPEAMKNAEDQAKKISEDLTQNKQKSMAEIAKVQLVELKIADFFAKNEDIPGLSPAFREKVFELKKGEISEPVQVFQDYAVIQLLDSKPSEIPPFEKVEAKATQKFRRWKAENLAKEKAEAFYSSLGTAADLKEPAEKEKLIVKESTDFTKAGTIQDLGNVPAVVQAAFSMKVGEFSRPVQAGQAFVVFQLKERKEFDQATFNKEKDHLRQQMISHQEGEFFQAYRSMLRKRYEKEIWINQQILNPPKET
jgi:peptidyl-prolyl cis-trans isomerase D